MRIIKLNEDHIAELTYINMHIAESLKDSTYYIPFTEKEIKDALIKSEGVVIGIEENGKLVAVSGLTTDMNDFKNAPLDLEIDLDNTLEIGGSMTIPAYRGRGYMRTLNEKLIEMAREKGVKHVIATAHPGNAPSDKSLKSIDMKFKKVFNRQGYLRNIYVIDL
ncbi:MAG: GNAT family N-acetyltransferase [Suipraeoptans sp.]